MKTYVLTTEEIQKNRNVWLERYMFQLSLDPAQHMDWKESQSIEFALAPSLDSNT